MRPLEVTAASVLSTIGPIATALGGFDGMTALVGQLGATGCLIWYCWFVTSKTIPTIVREHKAAVKELADAVRHMTDHCVLRRAEAD